MMNTRALGALILSFSMTGCVVETSSTPPPPARGKLTVTWTVDESSDPYECYVQGADSIDVIVYDQSGASTAEVTDACEYGTTSVRLRPGTYDADAVLLDRGGHQITSSVDLGRFHIYVDDELVLHADFPYDSFY